MSKRGLLFGLVALLVSVSFAGCLGDDDADVEPNGDGDEGGDASDDATNGGTDGNGGASVDPDTGEPVEGAPTARFDIDLGNATNATVGIPIDFNASESTDPEGGNLTYTWDFGDNWTGEGVALNHTYEAEGNYTITLTVTDEAGLRGVTNQTLAVVNGTIEPGTLYTGSGSILLPNPAIGLFSNAGFGSLDDHKSNGGLEDTHWQVHTVTGVPEGINALRFLTEYSTPDSQVAMKLIIKIFTEDGSTAVAASSFPSGRPDVTLPAEDLGETTYHVFVYSGSAAAVDYTLDVTYE